MKTTTNYGFKQPEGTDIVNIDDISDNFGSVDTEIKKANDKVLAHEGKGGSVHADATTTTSGFMSAADKAKLNGIAAGANKVEISTINGNIKVNGTETNVYTHPTGTNPHGATKADIGLSNVTNDSQVKRSEMGVANGVSTLDVSGANKQPPASHASTGTSYGVADTSNYGHVKIGDGIAVSSGTISADIGTGLILEGTSPNKKIALANSGVTAGTYEKVIVDAKGRVTSGGDLTASDIPNLPWCKITSGKPTTLLGYGITDGMQIDSLGYLMDDLKLLYTKSIKGKNSTGIDRDMLKISYTSTVGDQLLIGEDNLTSYIRGVSNPKWWNGSTAYDILHTASGIQQFKLTENSGLPMPMPSTNFNWVTDTGIYVVSGTSFTGGISTIMYGTLEVVKRDEINTVHQTFKGAGVNNIWVRARVGGNEGTWTEWNQVLHNGHFEVVKLQNGYQRIAGGLILQWGMLNISSTSNPVVTFPITFPANCVNITTTIDSTTFPVVRVFSRGSSNFTASINSGSGILYWQAIGY